MNAITKPTATAGSREDFDKLLADTRAKVAARKTLSTELARANKPVRFFDPKNSKRTALAGPDMSRPGHFRLTMFDEKGPMGHAEYDTLLEAISQGLQRGYVPKQSTTALFDQPVEYKWKEFGARKAQAVWAVDGVEYKFDAFAGNWKDESCVTIQYGLTKAGMEKLGINTSMSPTNLKNPVPVLSTMRAAADEYIRRFKPSLLVFYDGDKVASRGKFYDRLAKRWCEKFGYALDEDGMAAAARSYSSKMWLLRKQSAEAAMLEEVIARGESANTLYHYTDFPSALNILETGAFELTLDAGNKFESRLRSGTNSFYLSTTRSTMGEYSRKKSWKGGVHFVLDRNVIQHRHKIKPVDYYDSSWIKRREYNGNGENVESREMEDRVYSKKSTLKTAGIVKGVHVYMLLSDEESPTAAEKDWARNHNKKRWTAIRRLFILAKKAKLPLVMWTDKKAFLQQDFAKQVKLADLKGFIDTKAPEKDNYRPRAYEGETLEPYRELAYKKTREELSKAGLELLRLLFSYQNDFISRLETSMHNARYSEREANAKTEKAMRAHKATTPNEFYEAMVTKWRPIEDAYNAEYDRKWREKYAAEEAQKANKSVMANLAVLKRELLADTVGITPDDFIGYAKTGRDFTKGKDVGRGFNDKLITTKRIALNSLTPDLSSFPANWKRAIVDWAGNNSMKGKYRDINTPLRAEREPQGALQEAAKQLRNAIDATPLPVSVHVYRGLHAPLSEDIESLKPGDIYVDKAFLATSIDPVRANYFAKEGRGVLMHIVLPKGSKGLYLGHPDLAEFAESEMLLPPRSKLRFTGVSAFTYKHGLDGKLYHFEYVG